MKRKEAVLDAYNLALGAILFISPWLFGFARGSVGENDWVAGFLIAACSIAALVIFRQWNAWINLVLGMWLVVSPWILGLPRTTATHIAIGIGLVVAYLAALELWLARYSAVAAQDAHRGPEWHGSAMK